MFIRDINISRESEWFNALNACLEYEVQGSIPGSG